MLYKHLFFDLDHTLWDFDANSKKALETLFYEYDLRQFNIQSPEHFVDVYLPINFKAWQDYSAGKIDAKTVKRKRFEDTLLKFGVVNSSLVDQVQGAYMEKLPLGGLLMPNAQLLLDKIKPHYSIHIVTNGFIKATAEKMEYSGLAGQFDSVLSAEEVGVLKPNLKVFTTALERNNASAKESLFIGDNLNADVKGAKKAGIDQVFFNPHQQNHNQHPTYEITDLIQIMDILEQDKSS